MTDYWKNEKKINEKNISEKFSFEEISMANVFFQYNSGKKHFLLKI